MLKIETTSKARIGMEKVTKTLSIETNPDVMRKQRNYIFDNFSASSAHVKFSSITDILDEKNCHDRIAIDLLRSNSECVLMVEE